MAPRAEARGAMSLRAAPLADAGPGPDDGISYPDFAAAAANGLKR